MAQERLMTHFPTLSGSHAPPTGNMDMLPTSHEHEPVEEAEVERDVEQLDVPECERRAIGVAHRRLEGGTEGESRAWRVAWREHLAA